MIETAVLKTIAAFLNSREGGTLLIGVADDGTVLGLEPDYATLHKDGKDDADLFQLAIDPGVLNAVGAAAATNVTTQIHTIDGHDLCRVHVKPCGHPVHAEVTIVDSKASTRRAGLLRPHEQRHPLDRRRAEVEKYIAGRWGRT